jgi:hypothetical protein
MLEFNQVNDVKDTERVDPITVEVRIGVRVRVMNRVRLRLRVRVI